MPACAGRGHTRPGPQTKDELLHSPSHCSAGHVAPKNGNIVKYCYTVSVYTQLVLPNQIPSVRSLSLHVRSIFELLHEPSLHSVWTLEPASRLSQVPLLQVSSHLLSVIRNEVPLVFDNVVIPVVIGTTLSSPSNVRVWQLPDPSHSARRGCVGRQGAGALLCADERALFACVCAPHCWADGVERKQNHHLSQVVCPLANWVTL